MSISKIVFNVVLIILFFLKGTEYYTSLTIILIITLLANVFIQKSYRIKIPPFFIIAFLVYLFYLSIGFFYNHNNWHIDVKFQLINFAFFFILINQETIKDYLNLFFIINFLTFIIYALLYFDLIPNLWHPKTFGFRGRAYGPSIISFLFISFIYLFNKKTIDRKIIVAFFLAFAYTLITTNFMNLGVIIILMTLVWVDLKKLFSPTSIILTLVLLISSISFLNSSYVPELISEKSKYIFKPWEYASVQTRIVDFKQAVKNENYTFTECIVGKGFGASTTIVRYYRDRRNKLHSNTNTFQEIDNGFYYLFHRGGFSLLLIFLITHFYLFLKIPNYKAKIAFIIILLFTNLLSIHYFNYIFYMFFAYYIMQSPLSKKWVLKSSSEI